MQSIEVLSIMDSESTRPDFQDVPSRNGLILAFIRIFYPWGMKFSPSLTVDR